MSFDPASNGNAAEHEYIPDQDDLSDVRRLPEVEQREDVSEVRQRVAEVIYLHQNLEDLPVLLSPKAPFSEFEIAGLKKQDRLVDKTVELLMELDLLKMIVVDGDFSAQLALEVVNEITEGMMAANDGLIFSRTEIFDYVQKYKQKYSFGSAGYVSILKKLKQLDYLLRAWAS